MKLLFIPMWAALLGVFSVVANATPILTIEGPDQVTEGQTGVIYEVTLGDTNNDPLDIGGLDFTVTYDPAVLDYVSFQPGALVDTSFDTWGLNEAPSGTLTGTMSSLLGILTPGVLFELTFDVLSGTGGSQALLEPEVTSAYDSFSSLNSISVDSAVKTVSVQAAASAPIPEPSLALLLVSGLAGLRLARRPGGAS